MQQPSDAFFSQRCSSLRRSCISSSRSHYGCRSAAASAILGAAAASSPKRSCCTTLSAPSPPTCSHAPFVHCTHPSRCLRQRPRRRAARRPSVQPRSTFCDRAKEGWAGGVGTPMGSNGGGGGQAGRALGFSLPAVLQRRHGGGVVCRRSAGIAAQLRSTRSSFIWPCGRC